MTSRARVIAVRGGIGGARLPLLAARGQQLVRTGRDAWAPAAVDRDGHISPSDLMVCLDPERVADRLFRGFPDLLSRVISLLRRQGERRLNGYPQSRGLLAAQEGRGHCVPQCTMMVAAMADILMGEASARADVLRRRQIALPPEPFRVATVQAITAVLERVDRRIDRKLRSEALGR